MGARRQSVRINLLRAIVAAPFAIARHFPYEFLPTTIADLFDSFITSPDTVKLRPDASKQALACHWPSCLDQPVLDGDNPADVCSLA